MSNFLTNIINRHIVPSENIQPRLKGKFEGMATPAFETSEIFVPSPQLSGTDHSVLQKNKIESSDKDGKINSESVVEKPFTKKYFVVNDDTSQLNKSTQKTMLQEYDQEIENSSPATELFSQELKPFSLTEEINQNASQDITPNKETITNNFFEEKFLQGSFFENSLNMQTMKNEFQISQTSAPTVIKVSIGRIDVHTPAKAPLSKPTISVQQKPKMSLEDYLNKRNNAS